MTTPVLVVKKDPRDPSLDTPFAERAGECLTFAARYMMANGGQLVHGSIFHEQFSDRRIGHAWVHTEDGGAFEPTLGVYWPRMDVFLRWSGCIIDVEYSEEHARLLMLRTRHCGIWHDNPSGVWSDLE